MGHMLHGDVPKLESLEGRGGWRMALKPTAISTAGLMDPPGGRRHHLEGARTQGGHLTWKGARFQYGLAVGFHVPGIRVLSIGIF